MLQELIIFLVFLIAAGYLLYQGYKSFFSKEVGCAKGCGACSTIDLDKIQREMESRHAAK